MITVRLEGRERALALWDEKPVNRAAKDTLGKVASAARTIASEEIRRVFNVKKSDLDKRINPYASGSDDLTRVIQIGGKSMSLSYFGARQFVVNKTITRGKNGLKTKTRKRSHTFQGVEVEVLIGRKTQLRSGFLAMMKSGHIGVMRRVSGKMMRSKPKKQAIAEMAVISPASMVRQAQVEPSILKRVQEVWDAEFQRRLDSLVNKR